MNYAIVITHEAENDIKEAFLWYEGNRKGLGYDFLSQIKVGIQLLERTPYIHPVEYKEIRKHFIKRFPYKIIYMIETDRIVIMAVIHNKRNRGTINV